MSIFSVPVSLLVAHPHAGSSLKFDGEEPYAVLWLGTVTASAWLSLPFSGMCPFEYLCVASYNSLRAECYCFCYTVCTSDVVVPLSNSDKLHY